MRGANRAFFDQVRESVADRESLQIGDVGLRSS